MSCIFSQFSTAYAQKRPSYFRNFHWVTYSDSERKGVLTTNGEHTIKPAQFNVSEITSPSKNILKDALNTLLQRRRQWGEAGGPGPPPE